LYPCDTQLPRRLVEIRAKPQRQLEVTGGQLLIPQSSLRGGAVVQSERIARVGRDRLVEIGERRAVILGVELDQPPRIEPF
jgi:hypothetical protein